MSKATQKTATVEALTAEVRVLMVGSRQVTLSVARQLDRFKWRCVEPFGRVRLGGDYVAPGWSIIGRLKDSGSLVIANPPGRQDFTKPMVKVDGPFGARMDHPVSEDYEAFMAACEGLPLIVLAGLK